MDHDAEVFLNVPEHHGDLEADALVYRDIDPENGNAEYRACDEHGTALYSRQVPNTPEWAAQVKHDIAELFPGQAVTLLLPDGTAWSTHHRTTRRAPAASRGLTAWLPRDQNHITSWDTRRCPGVKPLFTRRP
ncbi:hypothetical protein LAJ19_20570 (plasmid) [Deinococcus taeanensis]|uniref:hypothetical protein n=1 Tax=Deinococcus taeanensis TaxID=2737050 RepID=UPI001CDD893D|nr:hypothetical protein [Deinococcus taeanensis]UBV45205.1 hypothetical protein LAJ19_20570 [Deinococcus taeanensis]